MNLRGQGGLPSGLGLMFSSGPINYSTKSAGGSFRKYAAAAFWLSADTAKLPWLPFRRFTELGQEFGYPLVGIPQIGSIPVGCTNSNTSLSLKKSSSGVIQRHHFVLAQWLHGSRCACRFAPALAEKKFKQHIRRSYRGRQENSRAAADENVYRLVGSCRRAPGFSSVGDLHHRHFRKLQVKFFLLNFCEECFVKIEQILQIALPG